MVEEHEEGGAEELECGICCMPYDRCGRAPRRLGGAHGSWKPSRCRHVLCSACVCQLAREGWWEEVTCPYCRAVTSLRERGNFLVAGVRRGSNSLVRGVGGARRRLVLPPIDTELWQRVVRAERAAEAPDGHGDCGGSCAFEHEEDDNNEARPGSFWRALKRLLKGGAHAPAGRGRNRARSRSLPPRRRQPINPYDTEIKDLALMTCYII
ncbi:RING finger protein 227 [Hemicordylus capensis]|uniref:RING finger protein 227 n=1 Tax=Hemicordylus capensis TaxID=884348 RepID=UPI00230402CB|nr:RING finger protein 227 [Hemicordylus capensis]